MSYDGEPKGSTKRFFTGRQDILDKVEAYFSRRDLNVRSRCEILLHGMPGVGKTEIALKIAENLDDRFVLPPSLHSREVCF